MGLKAPEFFNFERPEARRNALLVLLCAAVVSPNFTMPAGLPAIRLEQVILAVLLPSLGLYLWRRRAETRVGAVDVAFGALAAATAITLVVAPLLIEDVSHGVRDVFELARVAEYWLMFRLGMTVVSEGTLARGMTGALFALALGVTAFSVLQYLTGESWFNETITDVWAVSHNLDAVMRTGRVVGTIGNANYYGAVSGLLILLGLAPILLRYPMSRGWRIAALAVASAGTLSLVMSQSRTATVAVLGAMFLGLLLVAFQRRREAAYGLATGWFVASFVVAVAFVEVAPPEVGSWTSRFAPADLREDSSLTIRLSKWRSIFAGLFDTPPSFCEGERLERLRPATGHTVAGTTGQAPADASAVARDDERRTEVAALTRGVLDYFCAEDRWPADVDIAAALVPRFMAELPTDPVTGAVYDLYVHRSGFLVGAELEDLSNAEGPRYTLGTIPNFALNPSFETGGTGFDRWIPIGGATATPSSTALYGEQSAEVVLPPASSFYQTIPIDLSRETDYIVSGWIRPAEGAASKVEVYLTATLTDGSTLDPFLTTTVEVPAGDAWAHFVLPFETSATQRITVLQIFFRPAPGEPQAAHVFIDGVGIAQSTFAPSFVTVRDIDPSSLEDDLPGFSDSPIIGTGPQRDLLRGSVDNEYLLFLDRYGILGTLAYVGLFAGALLVAWRAWSTEGDFVAVMSLVMMVFTVALAVFNIAAGSYYHFQIMAIFWLITGLLAGNPAARRTKTEGLAEAGAMLVEARR